MTRFAVASSLMFAAVAACTPQVAGEVGNSLCEDTQNANCDVSCNPTPGAPNTCGAGFHCAPDGYCDARCTAGGGECGDGYSCTSDGRCLALDNRQSGPDASCPAIVFTPQPVTPSILLLLDRSGSMAGTDIAPTRYQAMRSALTDANGVVTQLQSKAYFGSQLYGCDGSIPKNVNVPRALDNAFAINMSILSQLPGGNTPTPTAINDAVASFAASPPPAGSPPAIILATDGLPNTCPGGTATEAQSVQAARAAHAAGIPVYVLAINVASSHFQDLANAGQGWQPGQPPVRYYSVNSSNDLQSAFQQVINNVLSCDLSLTSSIDSSRAMNGVVTVNGTSYGYGDWELVNGNIIRLQGASCDNLKSSANSTVTASFPCGSVIF